MQTKGTHSSNIQYLSTRKKELEATFESVFLILFSVFVIHLKQYSSCLYRAFGAPLDCMRAHECTPTCTHKLFQVQLLEVDVCQPWFLKCWECYCNKWYHYMLTAYLWLCNYIQHNFCFFGGVVLVFELRALYLRDRHFTDWTISLALSALVVLETRSHILLRSNWTIILLL
jgi:hypothetical protein